MVHQGLGGGGGGLDHLPPGGHCLSRQSSLTVNMSTGPPSVLSNVEGATGGGGGGGGPPSVARYQS